MTGKGVSYDWQSLLPMGVTMLDPYKSEGGNVQVCACGLTIPKPDRFGNHANSRVHQDRMAEVNQGRKP